MKKTVKAFLVMNRGGAILDTAPNGWNFHLGIFRRKYEAKNEMPVLQGAKIIPCTIIYEV